MITPTWAKKVKSFVISEIVFEGFDGFDVPAIREALRLEGFHPGISLFEFSSNEVGNTIEEASSKIYESDKIMTDRIFDMDVGHPRFYLQVTDSINVRLTISTQREDLCQPSS